MCGDRLWSFGYSIHVGVGQRRPRSGAGRARDGRESRRGGAARRSTTSSRCLDVPNNPPAGSPEHEHAHRTARSTLHTRGGGDPSTAAPQHLRTTRRHHCRYHRTHMVQSHTVESSTCTRATDTRRAVHSSRPPAPRASPNTCTVAHSGTWLGLGLGLGLGSARARARVGRLGLGLGLARARVGTSQCMPRRHAAAREPLSRTDGLERAQALIGLLLARVSK